MDEQTRVLEAFRACISEPQCRDCPWKECEELPNRKVEIPVDLALAVMRMLTGMKQSVAIDHEKILNGLEHCITDDPCCGDKYINCQYTPRITGDYCCARSLAKDALALLKEQQKLIDEITKRRANNGAFD